MRRKKETREKRQIPDRARHWCLHVSTDNGEPRKDCKRRSATVGSVSNVVYEQKGGKTRELNRYKLTATFQVRKQSFKWINRPKSFC